MFALEECNDFSINQILECGQAFRYKKLEAMNYEVIAFNKVLRIKQEGAKVLFDCSEEEYNTLWHRYFDMDRDYSAIKEHLQCKDVYLKEAVALGHGVRILNQAPFEMLMTFIISQNKSIPQIRVLVERLAECYGDVIELPESQFRYAFPRPEQLHGATEEALRDLKVGFRAPYLLDAIEKVTSGSVSIDELHKMPTEDARKMLMTIKGVGRKVADCVLLFGCGKMDVFPVDVWVKRIMNATYFKNQAVDNKEMLRFADTYFNDLSGIAQQYLFYYARTKGIGK